MVHLAYTLHFSVLLIFVVLTDVVGGAWLAWNFLPLAQDEVCAVMQKSMCVCVRECVFVCVCAYVSVAGEACCVSIALWA